MTQNQLIELLESEHLKSLIERAEEHGGHLEPAELETFVLEHDLGEDEAELLLSNADTAADLDAAVHDDRELVV